MMTRVNCVENMLYSFISVCMRVNLQDCSCSRERRVTSVKLTVHLVYDKKQKNKRYSLRLGVSSTNYPKNITGNLELKNSSKKKKINRLSQKLPEFHNGLVRKDEMSVNVIFQGRWRRIIRIFLMAEVLCNIVHFYKDTNILV